MAGNNAQIFFDTLPSCGPCKVILPRIVDLANENGAELFIMDERKLHGDETTTLPTIYIYDSKSNRTVLDGTATVGEIEKALGKTQPNFLQSNFQRMDTYFDGIIQANSDGTFSNVSYSEDILNKERDIWTMIVIFIVVLIAASYLLSKYL
jgi:thiol-disulfide isomerase/thioredoxin